MLRGDRGCRFTVHVLGLIFSRALTPPKGKTNVGVQSAAEIEPKNAREQGRLPQLRKQFAVR